MHRRWGKMWVQMRYISPEDDEATYQKMVEALERAGVPKHKVRYLLRYGPRTTVFRVSKVTCLCIVDCLLIGFQVGGCFSSCFSSRC